MPGKPESFDAGPFGRFLLTVSLSLLLSGASGYFVAVARLEGATSARIAASATGALLLILVAATFLGFRRVVLSPLAALRASEEKFRSLYNGISDAITVRGFTSDGRPGRFIEISDRACRVLGYTREELLRMTPDDFGLSEKDPVVANARKTLAETGRAFYECVVHVQDGRAIPVEINSRVIDLDDKPVVLSVLRDISMRRRAEDSIHESDRKNRAIFDLSLGFIGLLSPDGRVIDINRTALEFAGVRLSDVLGEPFWETPWWSHSTEARSQLRDAVRKAAEGELARLETTNVASDGSIHTMDFSLKPVKADDGQVVLLIPEGRDITRRKAAEADRDRMREQLLHSQKMEAMGVLAGGVAHDFNNLLTVILGYAAIMRSRMNEDDPERSSLDQICEAGKRASELTQSLLAFSRKQVMKARPVDLNEIVRKLEKLLQRLLGEDIRLQTSLRGDGLIVQADSGQLDQVLMNLAANARDAMPSGGVLTIESGMVEMDPKFITEHGYGSPGRYALLAISDTGTGMDEDQCQRIFEPFYTTKEQGKGTGLGLSIVYGIVKQHRGFIAADSASGKGTTFRIHIPLTDPEQLAPDRNATTIPPKRGSETILVAEDDPAVRRFMSQVLSGYGYEVLSAADGRQAVEMFRSHGGRIRLVVMDTAMPVLGGRKAFDEIRRMFPETRVLFVSGYAADIVRGQGEIEVDVPLLAKPIDPETLGRRVREMLDSGRTGAMGEEPQ
jgi:PAS domain S-box-containing protein